MTSLLAATVPAEAETLNELAQRTHYHGISFNRAGGSARLLIAAHHGMFAVDSGGNVTQMTPPQDFMGFTPDPANPMRYFGSGHPAGGGNSGLIVSVDGGVTWKTLSDGENGPADFHSLTVSAADPKVIYGAFGGMQTSRDGGVTWQSTGPQPEQLVALAASSQNSDQVFAATQSGLKVSNDRGMTWQDAGFNGEVVSAIEISPQGAVYVYVIGQGLMSSQEPGMTSWAGLANGFGDSIPLHIAVNPANGGDLALTTQKNEILESTDGGKSWLPVGAAAP